MSLGFTYMGTKRQIAGDVANVIAAAPPGPLLDAFAGMSAVGAAIAPQRAVWCNDVQHFAYTVASALFTARGTPLVSPAAMARCEVAFERNRARLLRDFADRVRCEEEAYESGRVRDIRRLVHDLTEANTSPDAERLRTRHRRNLTRYPYRLFSISYAGTYVGLAQAIDIDSIRFAIDTLGAEQSINPDTRRWMLIALCRALARVSNSTGHFAQYLSIKQHTKARYLAQRRRSILNEWRSALDEMRPLGGLEWRQTNRAFRSESVKLIRSLSRHKIQPSVIYCDPPYTSDHYSRYYHLVETLLLYDYPRLESKGLYRPDRFNSPFSVKTQVREAFGQLIHAASRLPVTLVLSYPDNGLLPRPRETLVEMLREQFAQVDIAAQVMHRHSTLGASKGVGKSSVTELLFVAKN